MTDVDEVPRREPMLQTTRPDLTVPPDLVFGDSVVVVRLRGERTLLGREEAGWLRDGLTAWLDATALEG